MLPTTSCCCQTLRHWRTDPSPAWQRWPACRGTGRDCLMDSCSASVRRIGGHAHAQHIVLWRTGFRSCCSFWGTTLFTVSRRLRAAVSSDGSRMPLPYTRMHTQITFRLLAHNLLSICQHLSACLACHVHTTANIFAQSVFLLPPPPPRPHFPCLPQTCGMYQRLWPCMSSWV